MPHIGQELLTLSGTPDFTSFGELIDNTDNANNTTHHSIPDDERLHILDAVVHTVMLIRFIMKATKQASRLHSTVHYI